MAFAWPDGLTENSPSVDHAQMRKALPFVLVSLWLTGCCCAGKSHTAGAIASSSAIASASAPEPEAMAAPTVSASVLPLGPRPPGAVCQSNKDCVDDAPCLFHDGVSHCSKKCSTTVDCPEHMKICHEMTGLGKKLEKQKLCIPGDVSVDARTILRDYQNNEVRADELYKFKDVTVYGLVRSIKRNDANQIEIVLSTAGEDDVSAVRCLMNEESAPQVAKLKKGGSATLYGAVEGLDRVVEMTLCKVRLSTANGHDRRHMVRTIFLARLLIKEPARSTANAASLTS